MRLYLRTALDWDLAVGLAVGGLVAWLACDSAVREEGVTLAVAAGAVGVAIISAVLTAMAVISTLFDGPYRRVLEDAGGVREAMAPYLVVAAIAGAGVAVALVVAIGWPVFSPTLQRVSLGASATLAVWCVAGTIALVELTIFHAEQRATLMRKHEDAAQAISGSDARES